MRSPAPPPALSPFARPVNGNLALPEGRFSGRIRRLCDGFGFIALDTGGECYFHKRDLRPGLFFGTLLEGATVVCGITDTDPRGPRAVDVALAVDTDAEIP